MSSYMLHYGDALAVIRTMPEASVQCVVTSPPYYGLRDYGTGRWEGGAADCDHKPTRGIQGATGQRADRAFTAEVYFREACGKCGAVRVDEQIGLERTPDEYIARLVEVFREVRRVLKPDGVLWINIGDSYAAGGHGWGGGSRSEEYNQSKICGGPKPRKAPECWALKPKDLIGIPWALAVALRADGWWLRQDVIWAKPNPMPESVKDRCTKSHEYLFMLTKSAKYFYDAAAIAEPIAESTPARYNRARSDDHKWADSSQTIARSFEHMRDKTEKAQMRESGEGYYRPNGVQGGRGVGAPGQFERNRRSVWVMSTCPTPEAHFATFPLDLAQDCILAGSKVDDVVLDPFAGAGTTGLACLKNGRKFIGVELNRAYIDIAHERARKHYPLLMEQPA